MEFQFEVVDVRSVETATGHLTLDLGMVQEWGDSRLACRDQVRPQATGYHVQASFCESTSSLVLGAVWRPELYILRLAQLSVKHSFSPQVRGGGQEGQLSC